MPGIRVSSITWLVALSACLGRLVAGGYHHLYAIRFRRICLLLLAEGRVPVFFQWKCGQDGTNGTSKLVEMVASILIAYHYIKLPVFNGVHLGKNGDFF